MKKRQTIKNIKRVSCRFDMDVPEERRAWQILQSNYQEPPDGKKQDYTSIIAKAMIGHYDRKEETHLTHEELLLKVQESIRREVEELRKSFPQTPFPMMYPLYADTGTRDADCGGTAGETNTNTGRYTTNGRNK